MRAGQDIRAQNVTACVALANIVKSSLGPVGLDKMLVRRRAARRLSHVHARARARRTVCSHSAAAALPPPPSPRPARPQVDSIGDVTVTNDGATILKQLEVEHPAAKVLVELAELQDSEVGDGTTSVVILAAELLKRANELVRQRIHPTTIMSGYRLAVKEAVKYIKSHLIVKTDKMEREFLIAAAKTAMSSKIIGSQNADFFSTLAVDAVLSVRREGAAGEGARYPVSSIHIVKSHGKSALESQLVKGFALPATRVSQQMPRSITGARIALLDFNLQRHRMQLGVQVLVTDPAQLEAIRQREADITKEKIAKIVAAGANVILTTKAIDDLCQKYLVEAGVLAVRRGRKEDLKRIAAATGGTLLPNLADLDGGETFDASFLGHADEVAEERIGDNEVIFIRGCKTSKAVSVLLRGANDFLLDEMDRALHDVLCVVQRVLESKSLVAGGGAVEAALAMYLESFATTLGTKEQLAILEFSQALLAIPKTLAVNAAQDATELVAKLCAFHHAAQQSVRARVATRSCSSMASTWKSSLRSLSALASHCFAACARPSIARASVRCPAS
jgi:T-complex protein 1 subunit alpha